jgi:hypothetical protein
MSYTPTVTTEALSAAAWFLRTNWGDYGYSIGIEAAAMGGGIFLCRHFDGSEFRIFADRYGNVREYVEAAS